MPNNLIRLVHGQAFLQLVLWLLQWYKNNCFLYTNTYWGKPRFNFWSTRHTAYQVQNMPWHKSRYRLVAFLLGRSVNLEQSSWLEPSVACMLVWIILHCGDFVSLSAAKKSQLELISKHNRTGVFFLYCQVYYKRR